MMVQSEVLKACERDAMLRGALETCAKTFRRYGEMHRAKGTTEGNLKASNNDDLAEFCESVLTDTRTPAVATDEGVVERVARAIAIADGKDPDAPAWVRQPGNETFGICWRDQYANRASAAISAMAHRPSAEPQSSLR
jgi:hypothetical protein